MIKSFIRVLVGQAQIIYKKTKKGENSMNELTCKKCNETTVMCDDDVTAVTCSKCVMIDVEVCNG